MNSTNINIHFKTGIKIMFKCSTDIQQIIGKYVHESKFVEVKQELLEEMSVPKNRRKMFKNMKILKKYYPFTDFKILLGELSSYEWPSSKYYIKGFRIKNVILPDKNIAWDKERTYRYNDHMYDGGGVTFHKKDKICKKISYSCSLTMVPNDEIWCWDHIRELCKCKRKEGYKLKLDRIDNTSLYNLIGLLLGGILVYLYALNK